MKRIAILDDARSKHKRRSVGEPHSYSRGPATRGRSWSSPLDREQSPRSAAQTECFFESMPLGRQSPIGYLEGTVPGTVGKIARDLRKGLESPAPEPFLDNDGTLRDQVRTEWWRQETQKSRKTSESSSGTTGTSRQSRANTSPSFLSTPRTSVTTRW